MKILQFSGYTSLTWLSLFQSIILILMLLGMEFKKISAVVSVQKFNWFLYVDFLFIFKCLIIALDEVQVASTLFYLFFPIPINFSGSFAWSNNYNDRRQINWRNKILVHTYENPTYMILNSSAGFLSPLALLVVMLPKTHLTSHSRMSGSRWVTTPL